MTALNVCLCVSSVAQNRVLDASVFVNKEVCLYVQPFISSFGQLLAPCVKQRAGIGVCVCVCTHQMDHETVDVERYGWCADVQTSKSVNAVCLAVKDTFNYNSGASSACVCQLTIADYC